MKSILLTIGLLWQINLIFATNYYVDNSTTIETVLNLAGAGDTVFIHGGTYYESYLEPNSGASNAWLVITNVPGEEVILNGGGSSAQNYSAFYINGKSFIEINGLRITEYYDIGIDLRECGSMVVRNCELDHNGSAGVALNYAIDETKIVVEDCTTHHNGWGIGWASGIHLNNKGHATNEPHIIRRNICYNNYDGSDYHTDGNGIMFDVGGGGSCIIENNICFNNGGSGINVLDGNAIVVNNTLYRNGWDTNQDWLHEIYLGELESGNVTNIIVQNNNIYARENVPIIDINLNNINTVTINSNLCWSDIGEAGVTIPPGFESNLIANPDFITSPVDNDFITIFNAPFIEMTYSDYDFHLQQNSHAIDEGLPDNAPNIDIENSIRPNGNGYDIGAYEYYSATNLEGYKNLDVSVYPNPATDFINIKTHNNRNIQIEFYSLTGTKLKQYNNLTFNQPIIISDLQTSIYFVKIFTDKNEIQTIKVIKK
jgi:hypothetical protein